MKININYKILLIIIDIVVFAWVIFLYINYVNNKNMTIDNNNNNQDEFKDVDFNNFTIKVPTSNNIEYDSNNDNSIIIYFDLELGDAYVEQFENSDLQFMDNYQEIEENLKRKKYDVSNAKKITYNGKDIITMDYNKEENKNGYAIIAYATIDDEYKAEITIYSPNKENLSKILSNVLDILETANKK